MKLSAYLISRLLVGGSCLIGGAYAGCSHDNCYRTFFPGNNPQALASGLSFCRSYTQQTATSFPPQFTSGCGESPSRYSSVCSCAPTITSSIITTTASSTVTSSSCSPTPSSAIQNGGFECGLYPWRALVTNGTIYTLTTPGFNSNYAFQVNQYAPLDGVGLGEATLSQLQYITSGTNYSLSFNTFWIGSGFIGVKLNGQPVFTVDAQDNKGPGVWNTNSFPFTATQGQYLFEFEYLFGSTNSYAKIDNVVLTPPT